MDAMLVALDVDGTLYDGTGVDPAAVDAVDDAVQAGHAVVIVSGRPWRDLKRIIPEVLQSTSIAVCEHGAVLVDVPFGAVHSLAQPVDPAVQRMLESDSEIIEEVVVYEATIGLPASARELAEAACARVGGCYVVGNKDSIAIVPDGCDKGTGLTHAIDRLGMSDRTVVAIGDATNDLPMFAIADIAIAVANAEQALIDSGLEVTDGSFGAGVAEAFGRHVLGTIDTAAVPSGP